MNRKIREIKKSPVRNHNRVHSGRGSIRAVKNDGMPQYLNEKQVSEMTGLSLSTLRNSRFQGRGLPYVKVGRSVRYSLADVVEYMESRKVVPADDD